MADSTQLVKHIELYVNSSSTPVQQAASVDAIATLLKNDLFTLEALVREMEMYLTTTDSIIRSRGILLLAELLSQLTSKRLNDASIESLIGFFTEKLCLSLGMDRKFGSSSKQESGSVWIRIVYLVQHLRKESQALKVGPMRRVGLDELVVEKKS
ncbi:MMS19 nucleotide excision repair protein [Forsythia ovata]|uniref:MMS19 nucleotide excision repair protein n=1 Tax=Forsythia ovata TaxID=205694 RepID=A0ABD1TUA1_9LAMI